MDSTAVLAFILGFTKRPPIVVSIGRRCCARMAVSAWHTKAHGSAFEPQQTQIHVAPDRRQHTEGIQYRRQKAVDRCNRAPSTGRPSAVLHTCHVRCFAGLIASQRSRHHIWTNPDRMRAIMQRMGCVQDHLGSTDGQCAAKAAMGWCRCVHNKSVIKVPLVE